ncbi:MAG: HAD family hydrolase [Myxococcales bacterium]
MPASRHPAVLFDLGNVLVRLDMERGLEHLRRLAPATAPASLDLARTYFSEASLACNRGALAPERFLETLARDLRIPDVPRDALAAAWCDIFTRWAEMESVAERVLAAGHAAFLLSNTDPLHYAWLSTRLPVLRQLSGLFLSFENGVLKPDPAFFVAALRRFALDARHCVFLDDRPENVESARSVGIRAHVVRGDHLEVVELLRANEVAL